MTPLQKRCQELLPVIQAGAEGKAIQCLPNDRTREHWLDLKGPYIQFFSDLNYRIKPSPRYRPFTPEEALTHCGRRIRYKYLDACVLKSVASDGAVYFDDGCHGTVAGMLERATFVDDGSPCGVLVTE